MFETFLFVFFAVNTLYVCVLAIAGRFYTGKHVPVATSFQRIAVLVPCYKEDEVIIPTVQHLFSLNYPEEYYDIVVIADSMQPPTLDMLVRLGCTVLPVEFEVSMKSRALNYALQQLPAERYDIAVIIDADNMLSRDFLMDVNNLFHAGYKVLQAQRVPKNRDTPMALLDGASEGINNHLFRQGGHALGLSSSLSGSGMSFPFALLKTSLAGIDSTVEDKGLQQVLAEHGHRIYYQKDMLVFDEKVESPEAYKRQRTRWIAGQYRMLRENFFKGFRLLMKGNLNFFNLAVCHNFFPSRIHSIIGLFVFSALFTVLFFSQPNVVIRWWGITVLYMSALAVALPRIFYSLQVARSFLILPIVIVKTIQATILSAMTNRGFIHTLHRNGPRSTIHGPQ